MADPAKSTSAIERFRWIDLLTVVSSVGVVFLHCNLLYWNRPSGASGWLSNATECLFYCCVPVFFMISGHTLLDFRKRYGVREFLWRRFRRAGVPFLFWSVMAWLAMGHGGPADLLLSVVNTTAIPIYWFFPPLFGCYVSMLVLSCVRGKQRMFGLLVLLLFITNSVLPFCGDVFRLSLSSAWKWPLGPEFILFVLLGYVLGHSRLPRWGLWLICLLGVIGFVVHFSGTWRLSPVGGPINMRFKGYMNWPSVLYATAVFAVFMKADWHWLFSCRWAARAVDALKSASLSIYLLHGFLVYWIFPRVLPRVLGADWNGSVAYRLLAPLAITVTCVVIHRVLRRVPVVRYVLG